MSVNVINTYRVAHMKWHNQ